MSISKRYHKDVYCGYADTFLMSTTSITSYHILLNFGPASVAQLDANSTGDQEVAGVTPAKVGNILCGD